MLHRLLQREEGRAFAARSSLVVAEARGGDLVRRGDFATGSDALVNY